MKSHTKCNLTQLQSLSACQSAIIEIDNIMIPRWSTGAVLKHKKTKGLLREITKRACRISNRKSTTQREV